jgi:hypothetical protein
VFHKIQSGNTVNELVLPFERVTMNDVEVVGG